MNILIINGSPRGKNGNTEIFVKHFALGIKAHCEIRCAANEGSKQLAEYSQLFDTVIIAMPMYLHAMPGIVMKIVEHMEPAEDGSQRIGFIVQSGFMESAQARYLENYLSGLAKQLNYTYLGTVIRGGSAGVSMMPENMNKKLFAQLKTLGEQFDLNGSFDKEVIKTMARPVNLSKGKCRMLQCMNRFGIGDSMFWRYMLKTNKAFDKRFDKPFRNSSGTT
jgi:multimeric flavodoxin WrbA